MADHLQNGIAVEENSGNLEQGPAEEKDERRGGQVSPPALACVFLVVDGAVPLLGFIFLEIVIVLPDES